MAEMEPRPDIEQARGRSGPGGLHRDTEPFRSCPYPDGIPDRFCCGHHQHASAVIGERHQSPSEALLYPSRDGHSIGQPEASRDDGRRPRSRQLEQR